MDRAALLEKLRQQPKLPPCLIGFDGFTDEIITAVKTRQGTEQLVPFQTIASFGKYILDSSGQSANIELIVKQTKLGGNAPILTNALLECNCPIVFAGTIGTESEIEPLFRTLADRCQAVFPLGPSGHSEAIEFQDGKIIFGKLESLIHLSYDHILQKIGKERWIAYLDQAPIFVSANWTMIPGMTEIWKRILSDLVPHLSKKKRWMFVDLADPAKRSDQEIREALIVLKQFTGPYEVILGLNTSEAKRIAAVLETDASAEAIQKKTGLDQVLVHHKHDAFAANRNGTFSQKSFFVEKPLLSTGAGDNFNAGYCYGLLAGLDMQEALLTAVAASGFYVRYGKSPTIPELTAFLKD